MITYSLIEVINIETTDDFNNFFLTADENINSLLR